MHSRYSEHIQSLIAGVLDSPGETSSALRHAVEAQAAQLSGRASDSQMEEVPPELKRYVTTVALHAYRIGDEDIEALVAAGYSEEAIFELTVSAALGAGMSRLEHGLNALKGAGDATQDH